MPAKVNIHHIPKYKPMDFSIDDNVEYPPSIRTKTAKDTTTIVADAAPNHNSDTFRIGSIYHQSSRTGCQQQLANVCNGSLAALHHDIT